MYETNSQIVGKNIITYTPKGNKKSSEEHIRQYLKKFELYSALKLIGEISYKIFESPKQSIIEIKGVPVFDGVLAYIAMNLIESSNDYHSQNFTLNNLLEAIDMYFGLTDPFEDYGENPEGFLIRFGSTQFDYNRELRHTIPRSLILYKDLWGKTTNSKNIDLEQTFQELFQLNLEEMLLLGFLFTSTAKKGFFRLYENIDKHEQLSDEFKSKLSLEKQKNFIDFIACKYQTFRKKSTKSTVEPKYQKFRFNPLIIYPALIPDKNIKPTSGLGQVYIAPIPRLISERVVRGLYFILSDHFTDKKSNPFKTAFGEVFEEYVGLIFQKSIEKYEVKKEFQYGKPVIDSPDWLILDSENQKAIVIEVKQSCLYLPAKTFGEIEDIQKSIKQTISKGIEQIYQFETNIKNNQYPELEFLNDVEIVERIIVTYDRSYFNNYVLRDQIKEVNNKIPDDYHWHTISIEELEYIFGTLSNDIFDFLAEKKNSNDVDEMDFLDYYAHKYPQSEINNLYLNEIYDKFFDELKMLKEKQ